MPQKTLFKFVSLISLLIITINFPSNVFSQGKDKEKQELKTSDNMPQNSPIKEFILKNILPIHLPQSTQKNKEIAYRTHNTKYFTIRYHQESQRHSRYLQNRADTLFEELLGKTPWQKPQEKIQITITTYGTEFFDHTKVSPYRATAIYQNKEIILGPTFWNSNFYGGIQSSKNLPIEPLYADTLFLHELTHILHDYNENKQKQDSYNQDPQGKILWVNEGLAVYLSNGFDLAQYTNLNQAVKTNTLLPLASMQDTFLGNLSSQQSSLVYAQGYSIFYYLEKNYGPYKMQNFLELITQEKIEDAFYKTYNIKFSQLEKDWKKWVNKESTTLNHLQYSHQPQENDSQKNLTIILSQ